MENWKTGDSAPHEHENREGGVEDLLDEASQCDSRGDLTQALYLYLAAYERAQADFQGSFLFEGHPALEGLRRAWDIACAQENHNLAAHALELLEPYLGLDELSGYASKLEKLALGGLGLKVSSSGSSQDITALISKDFVQALKDSTRKAREALEAGESEDAEDAADLALEGPADDSEPLGPGSCRLDALVGYDRQIERLEQFGVFAAAADNEFLRQMSLQHGIDALPPRKAILFKAEAREDADRLMLAVAAEFHKPTIRMRVDENAFAATVLCVVAANGFDPRNGFAQANQSLPEVLVLEGVDSWVSPSIMFAGQYLDDDYQQGLTKGAYRAIAYIRAALANPDVTVFASASTCDDGNGFVEGLLGPVDVFDVELPDADARDALWDHLMDAHPSLSALDRFELVRLSQNLWRSDIEAAAHEAVQQAFDESIARHEFVPVMRGNVLDKIAAYQPLDSSEYREIEDSLVEDLARDIERFDAQEAEDGHGV